MVDIYDKDENIVIKADLPGVDVDGLRRSGLARFVERAGSLSRL